MATSLKIIPDTYRPIPEGLDQIGPAEVSSCTWCEFSTGSCCNSPAISTHGGQSIYEIVKFAKDVTMKMKAPNIEPVHYEEKLTAREISWLSMFQGSCPGYRPGAWTRLLRGLGLRRPVMR